MMNKNMKYLKKFNENKKINKDIFYYIKSVFAEINDDSKYTIEFDEYSTTQDRKDCIDVRIHTHKGTDIYNQLLPTDEIISKFKILINLTEDIKSCIERICDEYPNVSYNTYLNLQNSFTIEFINN